MDEVYKKNSRLGVGSASRILLASYSKIGEERDELKKKKESFYFQVKYIESLKDPELTGLKKNLFPIPNLLKVLKISQTKSSLRILQSMLQIFSCDN